MIGRASPTRTSSMFASLPRRRPKPRGLRGSIPGERTAVDKRELMHMVRGGEVISERDLAGSDLAGADLSGAVFEKVLFRGADMRGCLLKESVLSECDLEGARMADVNMRHASINKSILRGAELRGGTMPVVK